MAVLKLEMAALLLLDLEIAGCQLSPNTTLTFLSPTYNPTVSRIGVFLHNRNGIRLREQTGNSKRSTFLRTSKFSSARPTFPKLLAMLSGTLLLFNKPNMSLGTDMEFLMLHSSSEFSSLTIAFDLSNQVSSKV